MNYDDKLKMNKAKKIIKELKVKKIIVLMIMNIGFAQEVKVDGDLRVVGKVIFSDSTTLATSGFSGINGIAEFMSSTTTWTVPSGITKIRIQMVGAGAGGASNGLYQGASCGTNGMGGSAGGYVHAVVPVIPGKTLSIVIGSEGTGADAANTDGDPGGSTSITNHEGTILAIAYGGGVSGTGSSGTINEGIGFIRNGGGGEKPTAGLINTIDFGRGYGNGGIGSLCGGGNVVQAPPGNGKAGYLLMNW